MAKITGFLVDLNTGKACAKTVDHTLESFYKILDCDTIDVVHRNIGGKRFNIICDDEALLKSPRHTSAVDPMFEPMLFGNLFVVGLSDENGDFTNLTRAQLLHLKQCRLPTYIYHPTDNGHERRLVRILHPVTL